MLLIDNIETLKIIFIIIVPIIVILLLIILLYKPIEKAIYKKKFRQLYGREVYKIALYQDYYLLNLFHFKYSDTTVAIIDHILFGDKYIYIIIDSYYEGSISGSRDDKSFVLFSLKGNKQYIDNPFNDLRGLIKRLSILTGTDESIFVGISLVNKECAINIKSSDEDYYIIQVNKLKKLIAAIESRDVAKINQKQLQEQVSDLNRGNLKGKI
ncbi:MAG: hypothetical protein GX807_00510 [Erysipelotrichia bacterium]|jgi:hypothetical protein|nr:hypothetical protein [Erysipelotrichia bacterium]